MSEERNTKKEEIPKMKPFDWLLIAIIIIGIVVAIPIVFSFLSTESNVLYEDDLLVSGTIIDVVYTDYFYIEADTKVEISFTNFESSSGHELWVILKSKEGHHALAGTISSDAVLERTVSNSGDYRFSFACNTVITLGSISFHLKIIKT